MKTTLIAAAAAALALGTFSTQASAHDPVAGALLGTAIGAAAGGPVGAAVGAVIGTVIASDPYSRRGYRDGPYDSGDRGYGYRGEYRGDYGPRAYYRAEPRRYRDYDRAYYEPPRRAHRERYRDDRRYWR